MKPTRLRETVAFRKTDPSGIQQVEAAVQRAVRRVREERERAVRDRDVRRPVWKSTFYGAFSTPSTRRLLDGVALPVHHHSMEPARPRPRREMTL